MSYSGLCPALFLCFFLCSFTFLPHMVFSHQLRGASAVPLSYDFQTPAVSMLDAVTRMLGGFRRVIYPACILFFPVCLKGRQSSWAVCSVNFLVTCVRQVYRLTISPRHRKRFHFSVFDGTRSFSCIENQLLQKVKHSSFAFCVPGTARLLFFSKSQSFTK